MRFVKESIIKAPPPRVWAFHELPDALDRLMPPWERAQILKYPRGLRVGTTTVIRLDLFGFFPVVWVARHTISEPPRLFEDVQDNGPFKSWQHRHIIEPHPSGAILRDEIEFEPFGWFLGRFAAQLIIMPRLTRTFEYRHSVTRDWCESGSAA